MNLSVIHPNREPPPEIQYQSRVEFAFCPWCRFYVAWEDGKRAHRCKNRYFTRYPLEPNATACCKYRNSEGECEYYGPSWWTRFVRWLGFRKPVWRD